MFKGFEPVFDEFSEVLILGSFPSVKSRKENFYYGNPQNRFWKTLFSFFGEEPKDGIPEKTAFLHKYHVALYDVFSSSDISGSMDSDLKKSDSGYSDMTEIFETAKNLKLIVCNGKLAYETFVKEYPDKAGITVYLPSTSPANPRFRENIWHETLLKTLG